MTPPKRKPAGATFWRLGGLTGWQKRTAEKPTDLAVSNRHGLRLAALPGGALSLLSADGSLGGLTLPRRMAFDRDFTLYLLAPHSAWIKRYDGESRSFVELPEIGGYGSAPRRFIDARNIAIVRDWLYVADTGNRRVQIFDLRTFVLEEILEVPEWQPVDLAAHDGAVFILDRRRGRVFRHEPFGRIEHVFENKNRKWAWSRLAIDHDGVLYLLNATNPAHPLLEQRESKAPAATDAGDLRDRFDPPPIRVDDAGRFCLPASLAVMCGRALPVPKIAPPPEVPLSCCIAPPAPDRVPPKAPTAQGDWLRYVVDREKRRVSAYTDSGRHRRHVWGACIDWQPCDVAACGDAAFILDEENQTIYRHSAGREMLKVLLRDATRHWSRIACDGASLYLLVPGAANVQKFDCNGRARGEVSYRSVAPLFEAERPKPPAPLDNGLFFDHFGNAVPAVDFSDPSANRLYQSTGRWQSKPLDSHLYRCQWHRIELELASFPPGSSIDVATCAHEKPEDVDDPTRARFVDAQTIVASIGEEQKLFDFLVQSGPAQFLTVRIDLKGDGFSTPAIDSMKVHYPRESYLDLLPSTYSTDDESRVFLERFLSIFQTEWDKLDHSIDEIERFFDPDAVPDGPFMQWLAEQWLALPLEGTWNDDQKRRLLSAVPKIYPHRGQLAGLRDFIAVYLANMSGLETEDVHTLGFPVIVEGFRERQHLFTGAGESSRLGSAAPLWSAGVKRRLQLGVFAREGDVVLVSTGDPEHDLFAEYAHRFSVAVPAAWVRTADNERMIRRAIEAEKPAQTQYDLCLIEPRFRLDGQSTIGIDTIIGAAPALRLGCEPCSDAAPSLPPAGRLGYDSVLSSGAMESELVLA